MQDAIKVRKLAFSGCQIKSSRLYPDPDPLVSCCTGLSLCMRALFLTYFYSDGLISNENV